MPEMTSRHLNDLLTKNTFYYFKIGLILQSMAQWGRKKKRLFILKVSLWEKIQRILIALKEKEKQKNNDSWKGYYMFLNKLKYLRYQLWCFFLKVCGHLGNEEGTSVCGRRVQSA